MPPYRLVGVCATRNQERDHARLAAFDGLQKRRAGHRVCLHVGVSSQLINPLLRDVHKAARNRNAQGGPLGMVSVVALFEEPHTDRVIGLCSGLGTFRVVLIVEDDAVIVSVTASWWVGMAPGLGTIAVGNPQEERREQHRLHAIHPIAAHTPAARLPSLVHRNLEAPIHHIKKTTCCCSEVSSLIPTRVVLCNILDEGRHQEPRISIFVVPRTPYRGWGCVAMQHDRGDELLGHGVLISLPNADHGRARLKAAEVQAVGVETPSQHGHRVLQAPHRRQAGAGLVFGRGAEVRVGHAPVSQPQPREHPVAHLGLVRVRLRRQPELLPGLPRVDAGQGPRRGTASKGAPVPEARLLGAARAGRGPQGGVPRGLAGLGKQRRKDDGHSRHGELQAAAHVRHIPSRVAEEEVQAPCLLKCHVGEFRVCLLVKASCKPHRMSHAHPRDGESVREITLALGEYRDHGWQHTRRDVHIHHRPLRLRAVRSTVEPDVVDAHRVCQERMLKLQDEFARGNVRQALQSEAVCVFVEQQCCELTAAVEVAGELPAARREIVEQGLTHVWVDGRKAADGKRNGHYCDGPGEPQEPLPLIRGAQTGRPLVDHIWHRLSLARILCVAQRNLPCSNPLGTGPEIQAIEGHGADVCLHGPESPHEASR
mmetsp:Transcript_43921/g.122168  ORF Transcript_43921/g.122168 Transcript_43921/m.122168 type:complete len:653 (+) Transcript_43921:672-2630(+)